MCFYEYDYVNVCVCVCVWKGGEELLMRLRVDHLCVYIYICMSSNTGDR